MNRRIGSHLTYEERCQIFALLKSAKSYREIGKLLSVHHVTIIRELRRNQGQRGYRHKQAQELAENRRKKASSVSRRLTPEVIQTVKQMLEDTQASPQQISGRLKIEGIRISHESLYRYIWRDKKAGGDLYKHLRHRGKKYNKRGSKNAGRGLIPNRVDIDERPKIVEEKSRFGDFELDTIVGAKHQGAIVSIVDRATKFVWLKLVPRGTAEAVSQAVCAALALAGKHGLIHTMTSDNGKEFSFHERIVKEIGGKFYFAKPYHAWERGLNEHTNGLVRQYFPKGTDFSTITEQEVAEVQRRINDRPRAVLKFETPRMRLLRACPNLTSGAFQC